MDEVSLSTARNGNIIACINGVRLQSSYDPQKEAERFIHIQTAGKVPNTIILFGCSLGYLPLAARKLFPHTKIVALFLSDLFLIKTKSFLSDKNIIVWSEKSHGPLSIFLSEHLIENDIPHLLFIPWPASVKGVPIYFENISSIVKSFIQRHNGSLKTTKVFGKRWIKNVFNNFINNQMYASLSYTRKPILITASGPSLNETLPFVIPYREKFCLIALPSSLEALKQYSLFPDFVITTDPGFWANQHLLSLSPNSVLIAPLSARLNIFNKENPIFLISDGVPGEKDCIDHEGVPYISLPPNGTVAGTALEFSFHHSKKSIFFLGLDLAVRDIQSHAVPHSFDMHLFRSSYRYHPLQSEYFERALLFYPTRMKMKPFRVSKSLETYTEWFRGNSSSWENRIFRVGFSPVSLPNIPIIEIEKFINILENVPSPKENKKNTKKDWNYFPLSSTRDKRIQFVISLLDSWRIRIKKEKKFIANNQQYLPIDPVLKELSKYILTQHYVDSKSLFLNKGRKKWEAHSNSTLCRLKEELTSLRSIIKDA